MPGPDDEQRLDAPRFEPLRPASGGRLIAAVVLGPILWLAALVIVAGQSTRPPRSHSGSRSRRAHSSSPRSCSHGSTSRAADRRSGLSSTVAEALLAFVALYPVCTAALWMAGGLMFRVLEERDEVEEPAAGWQGISVLIPAYNEESVIALSVTAALAADYPVLEVLVLDDGSSDGTEAAALAAAAGDRRCRVLRDPINRGKAEQLNAGFRVARHPLVAVIDAIPTCIRRRSAWRPPAWRARPWWRPWPARRT